MSWLSVFLVTSLVILLFQWRYCIRIENLGQETVQLRERHWRIFSLSGTLETVRGRGVAGQVRIGDGREEEGRGKYDFTLLYLTSRCISD